MVTENTNESPAPAAATDCKALTNEEASLATRHNSGKHCGTVIWVGVSGQEAKDRRAGTCADTWRADFLFIFFKHLSFVVRSMHRDVTQ